MPTTTDELIRTYKDVNPFLIKKWERIFNIFFDRNASSDIDWRDFYLVTRKVREIYGVDSDQMQFARSSMKSLWEGLLGIADQNKDEIIQIEEWIELLRKSSIKNHPQWFYDYMNYMFKLMDVSADDKLDLAEYTDGMATYGFPANEAHNAFRKFAVDTHNNSIPAISFPTFEKYWLEYFFSTDQNAVGNNLFGLISK